MNTKKIGAMVMALVLIGSVIAVGPAAASHSVTVTQSAQDGTTVAPGDTVTVDVTIDSNPGASAITGIDVPSGWSFDWLETDGAIIGPEGEELTWNEPVSEQNVHTVTYEVTVPAGASDGDYSLTANGAAQGPDSVDDDEFDSDTMTITVAEPDPNEPPTASFTANPSSAEVGEDVSFDASGSSDTDGSIASYAWDFGDGDTATGASATHSYDAAGDYIVELTVTDDDGATDTATQTVSVSEPVEPEPDLSTAVSLSPTEELVGVNQSATFDIVVENADGGVGVYDLDVESSDAGVASITDVQLTGTGGEEVTDVEISPDGSSASMEAVLVDTADNGSVSIGTITVDGTADGSSSLTLSVEELGTEAGTGYDVTGIGDASLTVSTLVVGNSENPAQDPDGDGVYEDVNGDGVVDVLDVQTLFAARNGPTLTQNGDAFDFNDDGAFSLLDIQTLYDQEIAS